MDEPTWLTEAMLEAMHADQIRAHSGQSGLRDEGLLESALARPRHAWAYREGEVDPASLAAEYAFGLIKNDGFLDGNRRIGFVATNVFLLINGSEIEAPEPEAVEAVLRVADGRLDGDHRSRTSCWRRSR